MNAARTCTPQPDAESLWLELLLDGVPTLSSWVPTRLARSPLDRCCAPICGSIERDVAPVQFHIDREADALWIVPGYDGLDVRATSSSNTGPRVAA